MAENPEFKELMEEVKAQYRKIEDNDVIQVPVAVAVALTAAVAASAAKSKCQNVNQNGVANNSNI